jgi:superfamily II DNA/RNA helicase
VTVDKIDHRYIAVEHEHKLANVIKLIQFYSKEKILIFTHTKRNTKTIQKVLVDSGFNSGMLNGNM